MAELPISDIARKGTSAHRADYRPLFDEQMMGLDENFQNQEQKQQEEELAALAELASIKQHPGYQKLREARMKKIQHYRSGEFLKSALTDAEVTNAKLGELVRVGLMLADELETELLTVEAADEAVKQEKEKRNGRNGPKPKGV